MTLLYIERLLLLAIKRRCGNNSSRPIREQLVYKISYLGFRSNTYYNISLNILFAPIKNFYSVS